MLIYLFNVFITYTCFKLLNIYFRIGIPLALILLIAYKLNNVRIIGITGGIASGKSTVSHYFRQRLKIDIVDCDLLARRVVEIGKPCYKWILATFGE